MKIIIAAALGLSTFFHACKPTQESATATSGRGHTQFAIVKNCVGELDSKWIDVTTKIPVKGELDITVGTLPNSKTIKTLTLRQLIPERRVSSTNEILPRSLFDMKNISVSSLKVSKSRGSYVTLVTAAPSQQVTLTSGSQKLSFDLVSLEFRNGDGADYVTLKIDMLNKSTAQKFSADFYFDTCGLENIPLLLANSKQR